MHNYPLPKLVNILHGLNPRGNCGSSSGRDKRLSLLRPHYTSMGAPSLAADLPVHETVHPVHEYQNYECVELYHHFPKCLHDLMFNYALRAPPYRSRYYFNIHTFHQNSARQKCVCVCVCLLFNDAANWYDYIMSTARSKERVCGHSFVKVAGSNLAWAMDVCPLCVLRVVR
jgi:hypothetical protein